MEFKIVEDCNDVDNLKLLVKELEALKDTNTEFLNLIARQQGEIEIIASHLDRVEQEIKKSNQDLSYASYFSSIRSKILLSVGIGIVTGCPVGLLLGAKAALGAFCFSSLTSLFY